ncbi:hypothetical protein Lal_00038785 [Lupinus albus]|uniref:Uncharacterized protein n=1 Tax=Lupinus albus TaxID=3870 RepID=A0A6A4NQA5_LUPAL|nr:hypothetical protein Lalb_Chr20g0121011 [Lupinus albus]KAF1882141.1 hypothetical protein Lal_00038785 [Lupinus albus]
MDSKMAYSKEHDHIMTTSCSSSNHVIISSEENSATNGTTKFNLGKELARRALFRSHLCKNMRRKIVSNTAKSLPSRLSKVSLEKIMQKSLSYGTAQNV